MGNQPCAASSPSLLLLLSPHSQSQKSRNLETPMFRHQWHRKKVTPMARQNKPTWRHKTRRKMTRWEKAVALVVVVASSPLQVLSHFRATQLGPVRRGTRTSLAKAVALVVVVASSPLQVLSHFRATQVG